MAGELEHIRPTDPTYGNLASRTRNINFVDANGVLRSITHVYWSPTNDPNDRKLIWQRDHTPVVVSYTTMKEEGSTLDRAFAFKYTATSSPITKIDIWSYAQITNLYNMHVYILDENFNKVFSSSSMSVSHIVGTLNVDGTTQNVNQYEFTNLNVSLTSGKTYYIFASPLYYNSHYFMPYVKSSGTANYEYALFRVTDDVIENSSSFTSEQYRIISNTQPKIEINGVQI